MTTLIKVKILFQVIVLKWNNIEIVQKQDTLKIVNMHTIGKMVVDNIIISQQGKNHNEKRRNKHIFIFTTIEFNQ